MNRCYDVNNKNYNIYGGRGITVCEEWHSIENFVEWAFSNGYNDNLTIDRIDGNGGVIVQSIVDGLIRLHKITIQVVIIYLHIMIKL